MKNLSRFFVGAAALVLLTACGPSKVNYEKFHEQAVEAVKKAGEKEFAVTVKGYYKDNDGKHEMESISVKWSKGAFAPTSALHIDEDTIAIMLNTLTADLVGEDDNTTYYAGSSFKTVYEKDGNKETTTWNQYGLLATVKSSDGDNLKVSYKK